MDRRTISESCPVVSRGGRPGIDDLPGCQGIVIPVHAHIQRRVRIVGKAPFRIVQLVGRDPQIQQNTVNLINTQIRQNPAHMLIVVMDQCDSVFKRGQPLTGRLQGIPVLIDPNQPAALCELFRDPERMTAAAQRTVNIDTPWFYIQSVDDFLQQY